MSDSDSDDLFLMGGAGGDDHNAPQGPTELECSSVWWHESLWAPGGHKLEAQIVDTVVVRSAARGWLWLFTSRGGEVLKKDHANTTPARVATRFRRLALAYEANARGPRIVFVARKAIPVGAGEADEYTASFLPEV